MDKHTSAVEIEGKACESSMEPTESNVGGIAGVASVNVELPEKETTVDIDPTIVTKNSKFGKINNMGFVSAQRKPPKDKTSEGPTSPALSSRGGPGHQTDLASIFSGAGDLERGKRPTAQKQNPAKSGVSSERGVAPKNVADPGSGSTEKDGKPKQKKRSLNTKSVGSQDLNPVVESEITVVVFDVETTGLSNADEVIQLSASSGKGNFNAYVMPLGGISPHSSRIHKITKVGGKLFHNGVPVQSRTKEEAWSDFIHFCERMSPVLLVGHNVKFDARLTMNELARVNLSEEFTKVVAGFSDTLPLMRGTLPNLGSYTQATVVTEVMGTDYTYEYHNSEEDVASLMDVIKKLNISGEKLIEYSFTTSSFAQHLKNMKEEKIMQILHSPYQVTKPSLKKLAMAGITLQELENLANTQTQEEFASTLLPVQIKEQISNRIYEMLRKS